MQLFMFFPPNHMLRGSDGKILGEKRTGFCQPHMMILLNFRNPSKGWDFIFMWWMPLLLTAGQAETPMEEEIRALL